MNRRDFIKRATALGVASSLAPSILFGCDEGDDLPLYQYEGPLGPENAFEHGVASGDPSEPWCCGRA
ncbi:MAG: twin-arginine translocation signal domain-containing protein [Sandaracinaceae bacterium]|nr:twin-arginine translocation signal domain-containing protein [Sandaracinaceae bacterium]